MNITREIALNEVYLDQQNALQGATPHVSVRFNAYDLVGQVCALAGFLLLLALYWSAL